VPDESARALDGAALEDWKHGNLTDALAGFDRAIAADPDDRVPRSHAGRLLSLMTDYAQALPHLERAAQLAPEDPQVWLDLASLYERSQRLDASFEARARAEALAGAGRSTATSRASSSSRARRRSRDPPRIPGGTSVVRQAKLSLSPGRSRLDNAISSADPGHPRRICVHAIPQAMVIVRSVGTGRQVCRRHDDHGREARAFFQITVPQAGTATS
jgi:tetratricopeptide (TPR) repeat protein